MAMVVSPLVSGLEVWVINTGYLHRLSSQVCMYARKAMAGGATTKMEDGVYKAIGNEERLRRWKWLSIPDELVLRRLGWLQGIAKGPGNHSQWLPSVFGHFPSERVPAVAGGALCDGSNPWAVQVRNDLEYTRRINEGEELWELLEGL